MAGVTIEKRTVGTAHRARWMAFALIACVAVTCGIVLLAGGWTAGATLGTALAAGALAGFVGFLVAAIRERDQTTTS